ncbi:hypothetical protein D9756_002416 [Leucocoprinus leucothites]|uniref:Uncharacterized protein n=1 Tax=Leucocoprinus leucothites TaxID=201217 RepID=A0A8H5GCT6_9AGAR|nr:hypothetical protein D9756_002416 [Leucoagaricus leucothites]
MTSSSTFLPKLEIDPRANCSRASQPYDDWPGLNIGDTASGTSAPNEESRSGDSRNGKPKKKRKLSEAAKMKRNERSHTRRRARRRAEKDKLLEELAAKGLEWFPIFRKFPDEFQRSIFKIAYYQEEPSNGVQLTLVSRKVRDWIDPLVYRTILLPHYYGIPEQRAELLSRTLGSGTKPMSFYTKYVRSIYTNADRKRKVPLDVDLLSVCTNIQNLECWSEPSEELRSFIQTSYFPKLKTLCINIDLFPHNDSPFSSPIFQHVTHLDMAARHNNRLPSSFWKDLNGLQSLTHMRIKVPSEADGSAAAMDEVVALASTAKPCLPPNLQYLVLFMGVDRLREGIITEDLERWDDFDAIRLGKFDSRILLGCYSENELQYDMEPEDQEKIDRYEELVVLLRDVVQPRQFLEERFTWKEVEMIATKRQAPRD